MSDPAIVSTGYGYRFTRIEFAIASTFQQITMPDNKRVALIICKRVGQDCSLTLSPDDQDDAHFNIGTSNEFRLYFPYDGPLVQQAWYAAGSANGQVIVVHEVWKIVS